MLLTLATILGKYSDIQENHVSVQQHKEDCHVNKVDLSLGDLTSHTTDTHIQVLDNGLGPAPI